MNGGYGQEARVLIDAYLPEPQSCCEVVEIIRKANVAYCEAEVRRRLSFYDDDGLTDLDMAAIGAAKAAKRALLNAGIHPDILREILA